MRQGRDEAPDGAALVAGLRRAREECFRVAEFSNSLSAQIDRRQWDTETQAQAAARDSRISRLNGRQRAMASAAGRAVSRAVLSGWHASSRRLTRLARRSERHFRALTLLRLFVLWRRVSVEGTRWEATLRGVEEGAERTHAEQETAREALQAGLLQVREQTRLKGLRMLIGMAEDDLRQTAFLGWRRQRIERKKAKLAEAEVLRGVALIFECDRGFSENIMFLAWRDFVKACAQEKQHGDKDEAHRRALLAKLGMFDGPRMLQAVVTSWRMEVQVELELRQEKAEMEAVDRELELARQAEQQMAKSCQARTMALLFSGQVDLGIYFAAWKDQLWQRREEQEEVALLQRRAEVVEMAAVHEEAFRSWLGGLNRMTQSMQLTICFTQWCRYCLERLREQRQSADAHSKKLHGEIRHCAERSKELHYELILYSMVSVLRSRCNASCRGAWTRLRCVPFRGGQEEGRERPTPLTAARDELEDARLALAKQVAKKKEVEARLSAGLEQLARRQRVAQEIAVLWADGCERLTQRRSLTFWWLGVSLEQARRRQAEREAELAAEEAGREARMQAEREAQWVAAMRRFQTTFNLGSEKACFHVWHDVAREQIQERAALLEYDDLQRSLSRQGQSREAALLETMEERKRRIAAATLFRTGADDSTLQKIMLYNWRQVIAQHRERIKGIIRLIAAQKTLAVFDMLPWVVLTCFSVWMMAARLTSVQAEAASVQAQASADALKALGHDRLLRSLCESLRLGAEHWLLSSVCVVWRRACQERTIVKSADDMRERWFDVETRTKELVLAQEDHCQRLWRLGNRTLRNQQADRRLRKSLLAWREECLRARLEEEVGLWEAAEQEPPETQVWLEEAMGEQTMDKALSLKLRSQGLRLASRCVEAWKSARVELRREQFQRRGRKRAFAVEERAWARHRLDTLNLVFSGWQSSTCKARQRWLRRRVRWLEGALAAGAKEQARPSADTGSEALSWALAPLESRGAILALQSSRTTLPSGRTAVQSGRSSYNGVRSASQGVDAFSLAAEAVARRAADAAAAAAAEAAGASRAWPQPELEPAELGPDDFAARLRRFNFGLHAGALQQAGAT